MHHHLVVSISFIRLCSVINPFKGIVDEWLLRLLLHYLANNYAFYDFIFAIFMRPPSR